MQKIIGVLSVATLAVAMFMNTNAMNNSTGNFDLANLLSLNTANAECEYKVNGTCEFKCDSTPGRMCKGEATVNGYKARVTCDGKKVSC